MAEVTANTRLFAEIGTQGEEPAWEPLSLARSSRRPPPPFHPCMPLTREGNSSNDSRQAVA